MGIGILACLDGMMNIVIEKVDEFDAGVVVRKYDELFLRGNNSKFSPNKMDSPVRELKGGQELSLGAPRHPENSSQNCLQNYFEITTSEKYKNKIIIKTKTKI